MPSKAAKTCNKPMAFYEYINGPRARCGAEFGHKGGCYYVPRPVSQEGGKKA